MRPSAHWVLILLLAGCAPAGPDAWEICRGSPDPYCLGNLALGDPPPTGLPAYQVSPQNPWGYSPPVTCGPFGAGLSCNSIGSASPPVNAVPNGSGWTIYQTP